MRTTLHLPENLLNEAMRVTQAETKQLLSYWR